MPAKSEAQKRWAYAQESKIKKGKKADVSLKVAKEFEHTAGKVPQRVKGKKK